MPRIDIHVTPSSTGTEVFVDGVQQTKVRALKLSAAVDEPSTLTLERVGVDARVSGEVEEIRDVSSLDDEYRKFHLMPLRFSRPMGWWPYGATNGA